MDPNNLVKQAIEHLRAERDALALVQLGRLSELPAFARVRELGEALKQMSEVKGLQQIASQMALINHDYGSERTTRDAHKLLDEMFQTKVPGSIGYVVETIELREAPRRKQPRIVPPPGSKIIGILSLLFAKKTCQRVFSQMHADGIEEYTEALAAGHKGLAFWIRVRTNLYLLFAAGTQVSTSAVVGIVRAARAAWP